MIHYDDYAQVLDAIDTNVRHQRFSRLCDLLYLVFAKIGIPALALVLVLRLLGVL
jgi:hypothetical protein